MAPLERTLERYGPPVLARLILGPACLEQLGVPMSAMNALERAGLVVGRMRTSGALAVRYWWLADEAPAAGGASRLDCSTLTFEEQPDDA